jgi:hypothetical protein
MTSQEKCDIHFCTGLGAKPEGRWLAQLHAARSASALARARGKNASEVLKNSRAAADEVSPALENNENERKINSQVVELAFIALQFVALTGVFSSLSIPDEDFLEAVSVQVVPQAVRELLARILAGTTDGMPQLVPPGVDIPVNQIEKGQVRIAPAVPRCRRIPLISWELEPEQGFRDKGLALGGIHVGVFGWSFGAYFPGSLTYALMHHGELARFEAPYSLPLLFNEDEWRNGYPDRRLQQTARQGITYPKGLPPRSISLRARTSYDVLL